MSKIINRYAPIPIELKHNYVNAYDYMTEIPVKVYEGESDDVKKNIYLWEFLIKNLPRKKVREIHIEIQFHINENSILNPKATEKENTNNYSQKDFNLKKNNVFPVENPKGLMEIIDILKEKQNSLKYADIQLYQNTIKNSIIEAEREINKLKKNEETNKELIKEKNKYIIEKLGNFITEQLYNNQKEYEKKIILSYIKFYFNKIANYFKNYVDDDFKHQLIEININKIIMEIQFYETKILFEIIEDFSDDEDIFKRCIIFLIQNLYGKFTEKNKYIKNFNILTNSELNDLKKEIENISLLFIKLNLKNTNQFPTEIKYIPDYFQSNVLKIKAIQFIREYSSSHYIINNRIKRLELRSLINSYSKCLDIDNNLLNNLKQILNGSNNNINDEIEDELKHIESLNIEQKTYRFYSILDKYPPLELGNKISGNSNELINIKKIDLCLYHKKDMKNQSFWNDTLIKYQNSLQIINKNSNDKNLKKIYEKIIIIINQIRNEFR